MRFLTSIGVLFSILLTSNSIFAQSLTCQKSICFETSKKLVRSQIPIKGVTLFEYFKLNLYTVALYAPSGANTIETILSNVPKVLILHYHRNIKKEWMINASRDRIKKNPDNHPEALESRLKQLDAAYQPVKKNDRYELRYEPDIGTSLILNGKLQVTIPGEDFQRAFFGVWLSQLPINKKLRDHLIHSPPQK